MPHRSTTDAGVALVHDIHAGWSQQTRLTTSVLTFDIVGAFDNPNPGRLIRLLWQRGFPTALVRFVAWWLRQRTAQIKLDGVVGEQFAHTSGLPQGSPLSLICFVIYISTLWDAMPEGIRLFGYVDDGAMEVQGTDIDGNCRALEEAYAAATSWASDNELCFDAAKRELIHFPPRTNKGPKPELPPVRLGPEVGDLIEPVQWDSAVKWLGIWLCPSLDWSPHVRKLISKAKGAVACLRMLANTVRGPSALLLRRAFVSCILPIMTYASPVWWRGLKRQPPPPRRRPGQAASAPKPVGVPGAVGIARGLDGVQNTAMRIILPVWRTTPIMALQCEASLPPADLLL
ncbi:hypothetical protein CF326_g9686 [Tilletia indica]|nr:hypothetical protein CF326_g9686 [Tilletia indica]